MMTKIYPVSLCKSVIGVGRAFTKAEDDTITNMRTQDPPIGYAEIARKLCNRNARSVRPVLLVRWYKGRNVYNKHEQHWSSDCPGLGCLDLCCRFDSGGSITWTMS